MCLFTLQLIRISNISNTNVISIDFITKFVYNFVMSVEAYEEMTSSYELYSQIKEGMDDIATGNTRPFSEAMADIRSRRSR